jgi:hypothetical protein
MRKLLLLVTPFLLTGCLATENRKVEITMRGVPADQRADIWWRTPYTADRADDNPWDAFVPKPAVDPLDAELEFFSENVLKWPEKMPPAYVPPRSSDKSDSGNNSEESSREVY